VNIGMRGAFNITGHVVQNGILA
jgi:hypothetical protein